MIVGAIVLIATLLAPPSAGSAAPRAAPTARDTVPIEWKASRPLRWSDFRAPVPDPSPTHAALTGCTLSITTDVALSTRSQGNGWHCTLTLGPSRAIAAFQPSKSWAKPDDRTDALLAHEQIHFDLAHIQARRAAARLLREFGSRSFIGLGADEAAANAAARAKFDKAFATLTREEHETLARRNREYDEQTAHGTKDADQKRWAEQIERELLELGEPRRSTR